MLCDGGRRWKRGRRGVYILLQGFLPSSPPRQLPAIHPFPVAAPCIRNSPFSSVEAILLLHQGLTSNHSRHLDLEDSQVYQGNFTPHLQRCGSSSLCLCPSSSQICPCDPELSSSPITKPSLRGLGFVTGVVFKHFMLTFLQVSSYCPQGPNQCLAFLTANCKRK